MSLRESLIVDTVKTVHLYTERTGKTPTWKRIPRWVDRLIRTKQDKAEEAYTYYKHALTALHNWFHKIYILRPVGALVNVPVIAHLGDLHTFYGRIDMLNPDHNELFIFTDQTISLIQQYNDIEMFAGLWAAEKFLGVKIDTCVKLIVSPKKVEEKRYKITPETKERIRQNLDHLVCGITNQMFYPSVSNDCSTCPYRFRCSI
jgi:hypothetical protein